MWTEFYDMSSGGSEKLEWGLIYIEADQEKAIELFEEKFSRDPLNVTCECCGRDYAVTESESLEDFGVLPDGIKIIKKEEF